MILMLFKEFEVVITLLVINTADVLLNASTRSWIIKLNDVMYTKQTYGI